MRLSISGKKNYNKNKSKENPRDNKAGNRKGHGDHVIPKPAKKQIKKLRNDEKSDLEL